MELLRNALDIFLHLDEHLNTAIQAYGIWTYALLFVIIFLETGVVVTPFLPGDSLLFAAGALAALDGSTLQVGLLFVVLFIAAVLGDTANYGIGNLLGPRVFQRNYRFLKREYLEQTERFYAKHGGKTVVLARFVPIVRTFAPFVAGVGTMHYTRFLTYNIVGGFLWTAIFIFAGYFFGNIPFIKANFEFVVVAIILISLVPMVFEYMRGRRQPVDQAPV